MTNYTPAQALKIADDIEHCRPVYCISDALRSLADQVEALTAENANILRASLYSADLATQAMEDVKTLTVERDALKSDAARYRWLRDKSEPGICAFYLSVGKAFDGVKFNQETVDAAIDAQLKEPK